MWRDGRRPFCHWPNRGIWPFYLVSGKRASYHVYGRRILAAIENNLAGWLAACANYMAAALFAGRLLQLDLIMPARWRYARRRAGIAHQKHWHHFPNHLAVWR